MAVIHLENLSAEYRQKLRAGTLTRETIDQLARSISAKCQLRKRVFRRVAVLLPAGTVLMAMLSLLAPAARTANRTVLLGAFAFTILMELPILAAVYCLAVTRVPRQFVRSLRKGYPELESDYGYAQLLSGSLTDMQGQRRPSFYLRIEEIFPLQNSEDIVAAGFAQGLIARGNSVAVRDRDRPAAECVHAIVSAVEKTGGPAAEAADCRAALRIRHGARLGLRPGMELYRE